jgi:UPF0716 protein FxsA
MRFLIVLILLAFPFAEIFLLVNLAHQYGWWLLFYLVVIGFLGLQLIRGEKLLLSAKMMQSISAGGNPIKTLLGSARNMVAGVLLIIPGVITDIIAVMLLLIPMSKPSTSNENPGSAANDQQHNSYKPNTKAANDDVIEGEYTKIDEDKNREQ